MTKPRSSLIFCGLEFRFFEAFLCIDENIQSEQLVFFAVSQLKKLFVEVKRAKEQTQIFLFQFE